MKFKLSVFLLLIITDVQAQHQKFGASRQLFKVDDKVFATPVLYEDNILLAGMNGRLYAINQKTGALKWSYKAGKGIATEPLVSGTTIFAGSYDGYYYAIEAGTGKALWKFRTGGERRIGAKGLWTMKPDTMYMEDQYDLYLSAPAADEAAVYFGSSDSCVYALDKSSGKLRWKFKTGGPIHAGVACRQGIVLAGSWDTYVYALDAASGKMLWRFKTGEDPDSHVLEGIQARPVVAGNTVYIGARDARLYALDLHTGNKQWEYSAGVAWIVGAAVVANGHVYVGTSDSYLMLDIDAATGKELRRHRGGGYVFGAPVVSGTTLCYGDFTGRLFLVNTNNWQQVDTFDTPARRRLAAQLLDSTGRIRFRHLAAGADPALFSTTVTVMDKLYRLGPIATAPVIAGNTVYAVTATGQLYAIELK
ncbi:PQQ-binding-like beta-propeller repeat protein [Chitinophaga qingshengii]|uniref:PQQ-binding-like beta-propeller repeat protein n=1 Tax=Chitinophaga qingshengii TaxID=1569794 RepID=A0ABR7TNG7_9BACT|nr:PQQ-binding-like beta-propeller repeat protein [Chitinophaga qingshengii]MBC9932026.1 PQQ-binding-like beta-propeller repeat protein [Chitinophaga qingshengii]